VGTGFLILEIILLHQIHYKEKGDPMFGFLYNKNMICPHCQVKGKCTTEQVKRKNGISGGKVMGGLLTGGISLLATGLSRKQKMTHAHCYNCGADWYF
jgi:uncharacterized Zn finger protein (UPF0148 family)